MTSSENADAGARVFISYSRSDVTVAEALCVKQGSRSNSAATKQWRKSTLSAPSKRNRRPGSSLGAAVALEL